MKGRIAIRVLIIASLYAILYYIYTFFSLTGALKGIIAGWPYLICLLLLSNAAGFSLHFIMRSIRKPLRSGGRRTPFFLTGFVTVSFILIFTLSFGTLFRHLFFPGFSMGELNEVYPGFSLQVAVLATFTGIILAVTDHNLDSFKHLQDIRLETKRLQTQQVNLRLDSLRSQISPHFLFNSLNTISSLIYRDVPTAEKFVRHLAAVYMSVLDNYERALIPLSTELELVEHYSYLMQVRFEDAFRVEVTPPAGADFLSVPPLSVQMLMENAVKHNRMSAENPLRVSIEARQDYLVVSNNFIGDPGHVKIGDDLYRKPSGPGGIGLENIKSRYRLLSTEPVLVNKDDYFTVSIPLIRDHEA